MPQAAGPAPRGPVAPPSATTTTTTTAAHTPSQARPPPAPSLALVPYAPGGPDAALRALDAFRAVLDAFAGPRRLLEDEARLRRVVAAGGGGAPGNGDEEGEEEDGELPVAKAAGPMPAMDRLPSVSMVDVEDGGPGEGMMEAE